MPATTLPLTGAEIPALTTALDERRAALMAMPEDEIERHPRLDASYAAETVIGTAPRIAALRPALVALCGAEAGTLVDQLLADARATKQADVELSAAAASADLSPMETDLRIEHALLVTDAQSLANRKLLDPQRIEPARSTQGYRTLIHNTLVLVSLLRDHWTAVSGHTPITTADLDRAESKANRMLTALGEREQGNVRIPAAELRIRALSTLLRHYDQVRRMVSYLRWNEGDADEIAPSLYARRVGRRQRDEQDVVAGPTQTPTDVQIETPASPTVNGVPASPFVT